MLAPKNCHFDMNKDVLILSLKINKHRHPNNSVGMGKMSKINKRRAYCYSEVKSTYVPTDGRTDVSVEIVI